MTFPQPAASEFISGQFWRLNTLLSSPGDIYESDQGLLGIAIGPDSDVSRVRVTYYDRNASGALTSSLIVSPDRAFTGQIAARPDQPYPLTPLLRGRTLITVEDLWNPIAPVAPVDADDVIERVTPRLDLVGYFRDMPSIIPQRSDNRFYVSSFRQPANDTGASYLFVPCWGRKYINASLFNTSGNAITYSLIGVRYTTASTSFDGAVLVAPAAVANGGRNNFVVRASVDGLFDAMLIQIRPAAGNPALTSIFTTLYMSDDAL